MLPTPSPALLFKQLEPCQTRHGSEECVGVRNETSGESYTLLNEE